MLLNRYDEGAGLDYQIGLRRLDAPGAVLLGTGEAVRLSPDSRFVLGITYNQPSLFLLPTGAGERRSLTTPGFKYLTGGWFPDGKRVLFIAEHGSEPVAAYVQDLDGGSPHKLSPGFPAMLVDFGVSVSPDSQWFFGWQAAGPPVIVPTDGGEPRALPNLNENDSPGAWTPDGHGLIVARRAPDLSGATIVRMDIETGRLETLKTIKVAEASGLRRLTFIVTPDGRTVVYNAGRYLTDLYLVEGLK